MDGDRYWRIGQGVVCLDGREGWPMNGRVDVWVWGWIGVGWRFW